MVMSASGLMLTMSVATSFEVLISPPPETVAVVVPLVGALTATFMVRTNWALVKAPTPELLVQVSVAGEQLHPAEVDCGTKEVAVSPVGKLITRVLVPTVGA